MVRNRAGQSSEHALDSNRRDSFRKDVGKQSSVRFVEMVAELIVEVCDISTSGCRVRSIHNLPLGTEIVVGLRGAGSVNGRIVNKRENDYGIEFVRNLSPVELNTAFTGTQVIQLFSASETARSVAKAEGSSYSPRTKLTIITYSAVMSWSAVIGLWAIAKTSWL